MNIDEYDKIVLENKIFLHRETCIKFGLTIAKKIMVDYDKRFKLIEQNDYKGDKKYGFI